MDQQTHVLDNRRRRFPWGQSKVVIGSILQDRSRRSKVDVVERSIQQYFRRVESSDLAAAEMARKELGGAKKTVINPLPGYD
jgi:hypothetical protein